MDLRQALSTPHAHFRKAVESSWAGLTVRRTPVRKWAGLSGLESENGKGSAKADPSQVKGRAKLRRTPVRKWAGLGGLKSGKGKGSAKVDSSQVKGRAGLR